ncbi:M28 family peptidase [Saltatorellus ferox]|uniref:M28 family peptidase n=1 Tax=Saltatorellus ferox TaxID=2528018 RepID=UPI003AF37510
MLTILALAGAGWFFSVRMPGRSFSGETAPATVPEQTLAEELAAHLHQLGRVIGARSLEHPVGLEAALVYLERQLTAHGYDPLRIPFEVAGQTTANLEVEIIGRTLPEEIVVVGAHYDGFYGVPAANDNGSGTAALLALAKRFAGAPCDRTLRFVFFTNEEPPHFQQDTMGSLVYARACRDRKDDIRAMWSLETLGYYTDEDGSQNYPSTILRAAYPSRGNFVAFVGNLLSSGLVRRTIGRFRALSEFPSEGASLPSAIAGVGWSDHWSFAQVGYRALMVTDTAVFRDPYYHTSEDLPERLDTESLARVTLGLAAVLEEFVSEDTEL